MTEQTLHITDAQLLQVVTLLSREIGARLQPRWLSYESAAAYSSFCSGHLERLAKAGLIKSHNVRMPGASRGRRVIDRHSLDSYIESSGDDPSPIVMNRKCSKKKTGPVARAKTR